MSSTPQNVTSSTNPSYDQIQYPFYNSTSWPAQNHGPEYPQMYPQYHNGPGYSQMPYPALHRHPPVPYVAPVVPHSQFPRLPGSTTPYSAAPVTPSASASGIVDAPELPRERMSATARSLRILQYMRTHNLKLGVFLEATFKQSYWLQGFFRQGSTYPEDLLDLWTRYDKGRARLDAWMRDEDRALNLVLQTVDNEMETLLPHVRGNVDDVEVSEISDFSLDKSIRPLVEQHVPTLIHVLRRAAQSDLATKNKKKNPATLSVVVTMQLANHRSHHATKLALPFALFCTAERTSRNLQQVLAQLGLMVSYRSALKAQHALAEKCMTIARGIARGPAMLCWDNIQCSTSIFVEQRYNGPPKVQSGTAAVIYPLRNATQEACRLQPILDNIQKRGEIKFATDVKPSTEQWNSYSAQLTTHIAEVLLKKYPALDKLKHNPLLCFRQRRAPGSFRTSAHPLRTTTLAESSIVDTMKVEDNLFREQLGLSDADLEDTAIPSFNDRLTNSLARLAQAERLGDTSNLRQYMPLQLGPGMFHALLNLGWELLIIHRGKKEEQGSLEYFIDLLKRSRLGAQHPDYHTMCALFDDILDGHLQYFWEVECGYPSLDDYVRSAPTATHVHALATRILDKYASGVPLDCTDGRFHNMSLLITNLLTFREFRCATSSGDFGRIEDMLGLLTMMYCGGGSKNYTNEFLYFIQNLRHVWPKEFADVMRDNTLINTSGRDGHAHGVDLEIEHHINYNKSHFLKDGLKAGWDLLADISPSANCLRSLTKEFTSTLGAAYQGITHTTPTKTLDIMLIIRKCRDLEAHIMKQNVEVTKKTRDLVNEGARLLKGGVMQRFHDKRRQLLFEFDGGVDLEEEDELAPIAFAPQEEED